MRRLIDGRWQRYWQLPSRLQWLIAGMAALLLLSMVVAVLSGALQGEAQPPPHSVADQAQPPSLSERRTGMVEKVEDGDTITVKVGEKTYTVQYAAIIAPEKQRPYGKVAARANEVLVRKKTVELECDTTDQDERERLVRYVWVDGELVNERLVREGYALADPYSPDTRYRESG